MSIDRKKRIIIGVTGSVASIKLEALIGRLKLNYSNQIEIKVVASNNSLNFFNAQDLKPIQVYSDSIEWQEWKKINDPIVHIELRNWADLIVLAPLSANTMAKIANGFCDNLLTCILRAWDHEKPVVVCPAMNTFMWTHPITSKHIDIIKSLNYNIVNPISKKLACGDTGIGAMAEVSDIVNVIDKVLKYNC